MKKLIQVLMVCLLVVVMGGPASGENLNKEIKSCSKTEDTLKRLICYDNISKKIKDNKDIESYIETQYMLADEIYGFKPKNKLNALGKIKNIHFIVSILVICFMAHACIYNRELLPGYVY